MNAFFMVVMIFGVIITALFLIAMWEENEFKSHTAQFMLYVSTMLFGVGGLIVVEQADPIINEYRNDETYYVDVSKVLDEETGIRTTIQKIAVDCVITKIVNNPYAMGDQEKFVTRIKDTYCKDYKDK